jgi:hypothetical protein
MKAKSKIEMNLNETSMENVSIYVKDYYFVDIYVNNIVICMKKMIVHHVRINVLYHVNMQHAIKIALNLVMYVQRNAYGNVSIKENVS